MPRIWRLPTAELVVNPPVTGRSPAPTPHRERVGLNAVFVLVARRQLVSPGALELQGGVFKRRRRPATPLAVAFVVSRPSADRERAAAGHRVAAARVRLSLTYIKLKYSVWRNGAPCGYVLFTSKHLWIKGEMRSQVSIWEVLTRTAAVGAACLVVCASAATASAADPGTGGLEIVGGDSARTVQLQLCPRAPVDSGPELACVKDSEGCYRGGRLTVRVRDEGAGADEPLTVSYLRNGAAPVELSGDESEPVFLLSETQEPPTLSGRQPLDLSIGFALGPGKAAATLSGSLVLTAGDGTPVALPVTVETRVFSGLTVSPSTLSIDSGEPDPDLTVEGPELAEYLESHGGEELSTTLRGDGDNTPVATLKLPTAGEATRVTAAVTISGAPEAGTYTGKLTLPELAADTGTTSIELQQHRSCLTSVLIFAGMLALVLLGILLTGFATRVVTMASRRKLLTDVLGQTYAAFVYVVRRRGDDDKAIQIASWRLDDLLGEDPAEEGEEAAQENRLQGLPALRESIETARSSADLDEDAERVLDMVARMQRWLRVEPLARQLALVARFDPGGGLPKDSEETEDGKTKDLDALMWHDSRTLRDTRALLEMARREPADAEKADDLVARLMFQIEWHRKMAAAWQAARGAEQHLKRSKEIRALEKALGDESKVGTRDIEEQDGLSAQLQGVVEEHENDVHPREIGDIEGEEIDAKGRALGITPVVWKASPNLFTGWATLDGQSYGQLTRRAATSSRSRYIPELSSIAHEGARFGAADAGWTAAILLFAAVTYGAITYSESWGSTKDLATAFLAGSLGKVTIDWAALPIFQSVRLRKAAKD